MKCYGDIPEDHRILAKELESLERWFLEHGENIPLLSAAKGFTCMSHDYFHLYFEEEGERLLRAADKICPGYFKGPIYTQTEKDESFACLVDGLKKSSALEVMVSLGFKDG